MSFGLRRPPGTRLAGRGRMRIELRDRAIELGEGDGLVVPRGVEHRPVADEECSVLLFEPASTVNTGEVREARTRETLERFWAPSVEPGRDGLAVVGARRPLAATPGRGGGDGTATGRRRATSWRTRGLDGE